MKITDIRIYPTKLNGKVKAFVSVTFDNCFVVTGFRIIEGKNGLFVSMPSQKDKNGEYRDTAFPITKDFRSEINSMVMEEYGMGDDEDFIDINSEEELPF